MTENLAVENDVVDEFLDLASQTIKNEKIDLSTEDVVVVHLGVNSGLKEMQVNLERRCFNGTCFVEKNKYVRGYFGVVESEEPADFTERTLLPINAIHNELKQKHSFLMINDDPGRYLCNYI